MLGQVLIFAKTCNSVQAEEEEEHMLICHLPHLTYEKLNLQNFIDIIDKTSVNTQTNVKVLLF